MKPDRKIGRFLAETMAKASISDMDEYQKAYRFLFSLFIIIFSLLVFVQPSHLPPIKNKKQNKNKKKTAPPLKTI